MSSKTSIILCLICFSLGIFSGLQIALQNKERSNNDICWDALERSVESFDQIYKLYDKYRGDWLACEKKNNEDPEDSVPAK